MHITTDGFTGTKTACIRHLRQLANEWRAQGKGRTAKRLHRLLRNGTVDSDFPGWELKQRKDFYRIIGFRGEMYV